MSEAVASSVAHTNGLDHGGQPEATTDSSHLIPHPVEIEEVADQDDPAPLPPAPKKVPLDITSDEAFPSLGPAKPAPAVKVPAWTMKPTTLPTNGFPSVSQSTSTYRPSGSKALPQQTTVNFSMRKEEKMPESQLGKTIAGIIGDVKKSTGARIEHSRDREGNSFFILRGSESDVLRAKNELLKEIGIKVSRTVDVPVNVRSHVIGKQGAIIKGVELRTGTKVKFQDSEEAIEPTEEGEEPYIKATVTGVPAGVADAIKEIEKIIEEKRPPITVSVDGIEGKYYPYIQQWTKNNEFPTVKYHIPKYFISERSQPFSDPSGPIVLSGDKESVRGARAALQNFVQDLASSIIQSEVPINARQQRFIVGLNGEQLDEFVSTTGCSVILPAFERNIHRCFVLGPANRIGEGVSHAKARAESYHSRPFNLSALYKGQDSHTWNLVRYLRHTNKPQYYHDQFGVTLDLPSQPIGGFVQTFMYADSTEKIEKAAEDYKPLMMASLPYKYREVEVDPIHQRQLLGNGGRQLKPIQDNGVDVVFERDDPVALLVYTKDPTVPGVAKEIEQALTEAEGQLSELVSALPTISEQRLKIPADAHQHIRGPRDTTLNALTVGSAHITIGVPKPKPGRKARPGNPDEIVVRGSQKDVDATAKAIRSFYEKVEAGSHNEIATETHEFPKQLRGMIIGAKGANLNKLKEEFEVDVQIREGSLTVKGLQPNVQAAVKKLLAQIKQFEDTAILRIKVPPEHHKTIIGTGGKLVKRLEDKYNVQIRFPKTGKDEDSDSGVGNDEVVIKGPKKGANEAREEIEELLKYEIDNNHTNTVTIDASALRYLFSTGLKTLRNIREDSGAAINIPSEREAPSSGPVEMKLRGTKTAVAKATKELTNLAREMEAIKVAHLDVDKKHHRVIIGAGGSNLSNIVVQAGGPSDRSAQARIVRFPKQESEGNTIKIEGDGQVVDKIVAAITALISELENRVTITIDVPVENHRKLIGREGSARREIESKFRVSLEIPRQGSGSTDVKVSGAPDAVEAAKAHIEDLIKKDEGTTMHVPAHLHHDVADGGAFIRKLRNDYKVTVDHVGKKLPPRNDSSALPARPANSASLPLITDAPDAATFSWSIQETEKSDVADSKDTIPWVLRGKPEDIEKAKAAIEKAIEDAQKETYTGFLVIPDPKKYRLIVGPGGSQVSKIRKESGCKIRIPKSDGEGEAIVIVGSKEGAEKAKDIILDLVK